MKRIVLPLVIGFLLSPFILAQEEKTPPPRYNLILITIDTLRADHLGCYGYQKIKTPNIDKLASSGIRFARTYCQVPITLPSHTSIMTGTYPFVHQVRDNIIYHASPSLITLAEVLKRHSYKTGAVVGSFLLDSEFGLDQGFDYYYDNFKRTGGATYTHIFSMERPASEVVKRGLSFIKENRENRFFLWLHLFDPHAPYNPPSPYDKLYKDTPYDGEIAYTDHELGKLLSQLKAMGLRRNTLIVLTADHGEMLGEHKEIYHCFFVYEGAMHIPLIISLPGVLPQGKVVPELVRSIDILPTILDFLGIDYRKETGAQGISLLPLIKGKKINLSSYGESYYPWLHFGWGKLRCLIKGNWKYIEAPKPELYNLALDPKEKNNLFTKYRAVARRLSNELKKLTAGYDEGAGAIRLVPDEETLKRMISLGYISGTVVRKNLKKKQGPLADPKDKIEDYNRYERNLILASKELGRGEARKALKRLLPLLKINENSFELRYYLGNAYRQLKQYKRALEQYAIALKLSPGFINTYYQIGRTYAEMGDFAEAVRTIKKGLAIFPNSHLLYFNLGVIYRNNGKREEAIATFKKALTLAPNDPATLGNLADLLLETGRKKEAIPILERAVAVGFRKELALANLARLYDEEGKHKLAEKKLTELLHTAPNSPITHIELAEHKKRMKDYPGAKKELTLALKLDPASARARALLSEIKEIMKKKEEGYIRIRLIKVNDLALAEKIRKELAGGKSFSSLARRYSVDPSSEEGGDIGFIAPEDLLPELSKVAFSLKVGEISGIIKARGAYYLLKREE
ncbi:MAG: sulfatase-like hydrolase/transferase [Acidobacteria bacterium]|nr:sulfatase-like hydrolase/transferase [Acidobacteriota bacterium]